MTPVLIFIASIFCFIVTISNVQDDRKKVFAGVVSVSLLVSCFIDAPSDVVHIASIAYNFIIFMILWSIRCREYLHLCFLYSASILTELVLFSSRELGADALFKIGDGISVTLLIVMCLGLAYRSNGWSGLRFGIRHPSSVFRLNHGERDIRHGHGRATR